MKKRCFKGKYISHKIKTGHIIFRKTFTVESFNSAVLYLAAPCEARLYLNGLPVLYKSASQEGITADVSDFLMADENSLAVHIFSQDNCALALDLECDGHLALSSDNSFKTAVHMGFTQDGVIDLRANETEFILPFFDDEGWGQAIEQDAPTLMAENNLFSEQPIKPKGIYKVNGGIKLLLGSEQTGRLYLPATGIFGDTVTVSYKSKTSGTIRDEFILSGSYDDLQRFSPTSFYEALVESPKTVNIDSQYIRFTKLKKD